MERFNAIEHYDPGDLTIGVGAGATIGEVAAMLRDQGQMLPIDIANSDRVTIGGAMAVAAQGPLKHFCGGVRDFCLGVRYVSGDGIAAKAGARVVKNVAGFDVMKLLIGSYGSLAVITSASFKLFPAPPVTQTFVCRFANLEEAIEFRDSIANSPLTPMCVELLSPRGSESAGWTIAVQAGGSERVLARYASELGEAVSQRLSGFDEQKFGDDAQSLGQDSPLVLKASLPPGSAGAVITEAQRIAVENDVRLAAWGRIAIGNLFFALDGAMAESYVTVVDRLRAALPHDASAVVTRCPTALKPAINVWGTSPTHLESMAAAKRALNPKDTLNRGRFLL
jgi:glycolate oxidase FAD binding subunit